MAIERGTVIDGKYEILKEIGRGGMSVVYLAMDNRLNKQWAVKVIQRQGIGKNNEVIINKVPDDTELMKRLDHPAIPRIVDIIDRADDPQIYIVMDYVEGESLDKILEEFGAQPQDLVIDWSKQICDTLGYLHSQKPPIIYRDMKPANIMLKPEGNVKLIDFGIAREFKEQNLADTTALGTRGYASPEHFGGRTDARSDIYTLGMTMHHLLTGADPRPKNYEYIPIREYNPELSSGLEHIIDKCTSWDPDDRYQNCNELMYDLEHYTEIDDDFRRKQKNKLLMFIISASLAVVFAIVGVVGLTLSNNYKESSYMSLSVFKSDEKYDEAEVKVTNAISLQPNNIEAYKNFLLYCIKDETISEKEATKLQANRDILVANNAIKDDNGEVVYTFSDKAKTYLYYAGIYHFILFDDENIITRANKAKSYFDYLDDNERSVQYLKVLCDYYSRKNKDESKFKSFTDAELKQSLLYIVTKLDIDNEDAYKEGMIDSSYIKTTFSKSTFVYIENDYQTLCSIMKKDDVIEIVDTIKEENNNYATVTNSLTKANYTYINENYDKLIRKLTYFGGAEND
ncbi:MAG: serine/threonine protein kinase [Ruminococcaceae bacterium]|nr:serine/threonine protein kinase [Oscillospiraceae bacterium]